MTRYTFQSKREDGSPRRYVGIYRPTIQEAMEQDGRGGYRSSGPTFFDSWYRGEFDVPLYEDDDPA